MSTFTQLEQTVAHDVYVLNAPELELDVRVEVLVLVAFSCRSVRHGVYLSTQQARSVTRARQLITTTIAS